GLNTGTDPRVTAGYALPNTGATPNWDYAAYTEVGKRAIGDLDYDAERNTLWFINLNDRRLHGIKNVNPNVTPTNADLVRDSSNNLGFDVNTSTPITCTNGVLRPFGIEIHRGLVYVGAVCTGENAGATAANLVAYVLSINPDNPSAGFTQVLSFPLNYSRTKTSFGGDSPWNPWRSSDSSRTIAGGALPQPIVSDLEIDKDGSIIMALKDRWGDQYAASQYRPDTTQTNTTLITEIYGFGDILRFCNSGGTLSNPGTAGCPNNARPAAENGANAGGIQGPGGGEFYGGDWGPDDPDSFAETMHGALEILPGSNRVVGTSLDPASYYSNGLKWLSNTDGSKLSDYNTFTGASLVTTNDFNKGNGLGDLELLCDSAPIEVGNRVWADTNGNGVQDAGESPISGVTVQLWVDTNNDVAVDTLVGTAVTDVNGEYYFVGSTSADGNTTDNIGQINGGISLNTAYQVRIPAVNFTTGQALASKSPSPANNDASVNGDSRDSDGIPSGGNVIANFTTGGGGSNNHTFDFGFYLSPTAANVTVGGRAASASGSGLRGILVILTEGNGSTRTVLTNSFGYYRFDDIPAGQIVTVSVSSKKYSFKQPTQVINVSDNIADLDFVSDSR
ncbi:MAG: SdrD B-like domain-containing protein, partial [Actinomycetota bacterium]